MVAKKKKHSTKLEKATLKKSQAEEKKAPRQQPIKSKVKRGASSINRTVKKNYIYEYYQKITDGSITVGKWIHLVYEYVVNGLQDKLFVYDSKKANKAINWIESHCFHVEGPLAPGNFKMELWEKAFVSCVFGLVDKDTGYRVFREILLLVGRKNGKSILASGIGDYVFQDDGGYGARVYNVAPKLDQADIIYNNTWAMIQLDPEQIEKKEAIRKAREESRHQKVEEDPTIVKKRMSDLYLPATNSTMKKISASDKKSDGFNPSLTICDEIASWEGDKGLKTYEVMKSGMGARPEALLLSCTTAGYISDSIYDELIKRSTRFLLGDSKETKLLPFLYMIDDVEKWNDINELQKSNPNLGVSVTVDYLLEEIAVAEGSLSKKAEFITKYCNLKQNSSLAWLAAQTVKKMCGEPLSLEDFRGNYCVAGIDLSQTTDLTAAGVVIEKDGELYIFTKFWLPAEKIDEAIARDGIPYNIYLERGLLETSGDNFVDYHDCYNWFISLVEQYEILPLMVGYDRYSAQYLIQDLKQYGFRCDDVYQGDNLWPVLQEMEGLFKDGRVHIGDNDLLKIHLLNSAIKMSTERGRGRLVKINPTMHIDGVAAMADAFCVRQKWFNELGDRLVNEV
jgi:phage terminase large subunit-like protein